MGSISLVIAAFVTIKWVPRYCHSHISLIFSTLLIRWYLGIRPLWNKSNLVYVLFGGEKFFLVYDLCLEYDSRVRTCMSQNES
jgi:hypothetical protein